MNGTAAGRGRGDRVGEHGDDGDGDGEEAMTRIRPSGRRGSEAAPGRAARRRQRREARLRESSGTVRCTSRGPYFLLTWPNENAKKRGSLTFDI